MPRRWLKNFSDLGFIQSVDKPRYMAPLLTPHEDYFRALGLDVTDLRNGDAYDRKLLEVFTAPEGMPPALLESLYVLDDLADEAGHDRLLEEALRRGANLAGIVGASLSAGDFVIAIHLRHPQLLRVCHERTIYRKIKNYEEYQAKEDVALTLKTAKAKASVLASEMAPWFEAKDRSRVCDIFAYEEGDEIKFEITHGRPYLSQGTIDSKLRRSRVAYRPQKHDSVIYNTRTHVLKLNAQTVPEKDLYRKAFGRVLFHDPEHFPDGDIYTLAPLRRTPPRVATAVGVESVRLTEVWIELDDELGFVQASRAFDLLAAAGRHGTPNLVQGRLVRAAFLLKYTSGGRPRKLEVRPPNVAIYDRARDGDLAEAFMRVNGFLKLPGHGR